MQTILIHNTKTNEIIEREMNAEELAEYENNQLRAAEARAAEAQAKTKRDALLERLGITDDEAKLLAQSL